MMQMSVQNRNRLTDLEIELTVACREERGKGIVTEFGMDMFTLRYLKWIQQVPTLQHRELCPTSRGSLDGRGVWGRMDTRVCTAEPLGCPPETITTWLTDYSPIQNINFFQKKKPLCFSWRVKDTFYSCVLWWSWVPCLNHCKVF